jgi:hypothetical protein
VKLGGYRSSVAAKLLSSNLICQELLSRCPLLYLCKSAYTVRKQYKRNLEARLCIHSCRPQAIRVTYSECVSVALVIQHATRMRRIILSSVTCLALPYYFILSLKRHVFRKKSYWTWNVCFEFLYMFCQKHFLFYEELIDFLIINVHRHSCKVLVILVQSYCNSIFPDRFF